MLQLYGKPEQWTRITICKLNHLGTPVEKMIKGIFFSLNSFFFFGPGLKLTQLRHLEDSCKVSQFMGFEVVVVTDVLEK